MDMGTIDRSDSTLAARSFLNTHRARPFLATQNAENPSFSLHMGVHHHHKLFGSRPIVLRIDE
ncbi:hypothetical protein BC827DRAFT_1213981, partial [Russula dissimulans]